MDGPTKNNPSACVGGKKKRIVEPNEFDFSFDSVIVLNSKAAEVRREQIKVLRLMQQHKDTMASFNEHGDSRVKTLITTYLKPKSELRLHTLTETQKSVLLKEPGPFQPDDVLDVDTFHFGHTWSSYAAFIEAEEKKALEDFMFRDAVKSAAHPFLRMPDLTKCGHMTCSGCGNAMLACHDVVFGPFCLYRVINYCNRFDDFVDDVVMKKIFIDTYNRCLAFTKFKSAKKDHVEWVFPPACMQDNSYGYMIFWYEWIYEGKWSMSFDDDEKVKEDEED